jgi:hypothetical protein
MRCVMRNRYYVFRARGTLPERAREAFCDMAVEETPAGATLRGTVIDDSHFHGILEQLRVLGMAVVSAHPADPRARDAARGL